MNKIDFAIVITAEMCNPNGDPLMANRPRIDLDGYGEMSSVCIKRKVRDRLQDMGCDIFVQSMLHDHDEYRSMKERLDAYSPIQDELSKKAKADAERIKKLACQKWIDIRMFGQVLPFKGIEVSTGIRGPVSIGYGKTLQPIEIVDYMQTTSDNREKTSGKDSNTMYTEYLVKRGVYVAYGSIFPQLAEKTGFSDSDIELLKEALKTLLNTDISGRRPSGSMVSTLYWWEHNNKNGVMPSGKIFRTLHIEPAEEYPYYTVSPEKIPGINIEMYN